LLLKRHQIEQVAGNSPTKRPTKIHTTARMESPKLESGGGEAEADISTWSAAAVRGTGAGGISRDA